MRFPDFIGIGAQKSGTTYLHGLLSCHPQLFMAKPKELHFFSLHFDEGGDWYRKYFSDACIGQKCGEITPYYLYHPLAAGRIYKTIPNVKLVVLLRDPVERAISQFFHSYRLGFEDLSIEQAFLAEEKRLLHAGVALEAGKPHLSHQQHSYLSRSKYEIQLNRYYEIFSKDQILILRSELLFQMPELAWSLVLQFLELDAHPMPIDIPRYSAPRCLQDDDLNRLKGYLRDQLSDTYDWLQSSSFCDAF